MTTAAGFVALRARFAESMQVSLEASSGREDLEMSPLQASFATVPAGTSELEKKTAMDQVIMLCVFVDGGGCCCGRRRRRCC